jgi:hypothetical protein
MDVRTRRRLKKLVALMGTTNKEERDSVGLRIDKILESEKRSWSELHELIGNIPDDDPPLRTTPADRDGGDIGLLDLVEGILRRYVQLKDHEYVAVALWAVHTHVFNLFAITPRLAVTSPTSDCGKTTLLLVLT